MYTSTTHTPGTCVEGLYVSYFTVGDVLLQCAAPVAGELGEHCNTTHHAAMG